MSLPSRVAISSTCLCHCVDLDCVMCNAMFFHVFQHYSYPINKLSKFNLDSLPLSYFVFVGITLSPKTSLPPDCHYKVQSASLKFSKSQGAKETFKWSSCSVSLILGNRGVELGSPHQNQSSKAEPARGVLSHAHSAGAVVSLPIGRLACGIL